MCQNPLRLENDLGEYRRLAGPALPAEFAQMAAHFPAEPEPAPGAAIPPALLQAVRQGRLLVLWGEMPFPLAAHSPANPALALNQWRNQAAALSPPALPLPQLPPLPILSLDPGGRLEQAFSRAAVSLQVIRARHDAPAANRHTLFKLAGDLDTRAGVVLSRAELRAWPHNPDQHYLLAEAQRLARGGALLILGGDPASEDFQAWWAALAPLWRDSALFALGPPSTGWAAGVAGLNLDFSTLNAALKTALAVVETPKIPQTQGEINMSDREHLQKLVKTHESRLKILREQKAELGLYTPPHIILEIERDLNAANNIRRQLGLPPLDPEPPAPPPSPVPPPTSGVTYNINVQQARDIAISQGGTQIIQPPPAAASPPPIIPAAQKDTFEVGVGFAPMAEAQEPYIQIGRLADRRPAGKFVALLTAEGANILNAPYQELAPGQAAGVTFTCQAHQDVKEVMLTIDSFYNYQPVGMVTRRIILTRAENGLTAHLSAEAAAEPALIMLPSPDSYVDLTVTISRLANEQLEWTFVAPQPALIVGPLTTPLHAAREFSKNLLDELAAAGSGGVSASNILQSKGQTVNRVMPEEFFAILSRVQQAIGRIPRLLLRTEETDVPWELAILPKPLFTDKPSYLAGQTYLGRWIRHKDMPAAPPARLELSCACLMAAQYGRGTNYDLLKEALTEQQNLSAYFQKLGLATTILNATKADLESITASPKIPGRLVHLAVHGLSDPQNNNQRLLLVDARIPPSALVGAYKFGETPIFSFVFLNACQVGTAGSSFGQAAGFPGELLRGGVLGFIAPLWAIHDEEARHLAEAFYRATLAEGQTVGEFWQAQREQYNAQKSATSMAYIFYGHPALRLNISSAEENND